MSIIPGQLSPCIFPDKWLHDLHDHLWRLFIYAQEQIMTYFSSKFRITVEWIWLKSTIVSKIHWTALLQMVDQEELDIDDSLVRYYVPNLTIQLCQSGLTRLVESWNAHCILDEMNQYFWRLKLQQTIVRFKTNIIDFLQQAKVY